MAIPFNSGYSGTPLMKKLGIKDGLTIRLINPPAYYSDLFENLNNVTISSDKKIKKDCIHFFSANATELHKNIPLLKKEIKQNGMIWVSWPKKSSKVITDITEDTIRAIALSNNLVDIKVCAIDETWSGLKLVIPLKLRTL
jgi:hypothetical protein